MCRHNIKKASQPHILHRDQQMTEATVTISHHTVSMQYTNMQSTASCFTSINIDTSTTSTVTALNRHLTKYVWCTRTTKCQVYIGTVQHRPPRDDMVWSSGWERSQCAQRKDNLISDDQPNDVVEWHTNARQRWSATVSTQTHAYVRQMSNTQRSMSPVCTQHQLHDVFSLL